MLDLLPVCLARCFMTFEQTLIYVGKQRLHSRNFAFYFKVIWSEVGVIKKDPKVSRDYLEIETDAQSLLRIIIMKVFRRDLQRIFLGMKDIPTRDVSAFTMVRNLIIGSLPRATSRKRNELIN